MMANIFVSHMKARGYSPAESAASEEEFLNLKAQSYYVSARVPVEGLVSGLRP